MNDRSGPGWYIHTWPASYWIFMGKYALRVGRPFGPHNYRYAWRPLFKFFRCYK